MFVGIVVAFVGNQIPTGWELCDGRMVDKNDPKWRKLFEVIGTIHGGDGTPLFKLPDYRGLFLRGTDSGANRDPDANRRQAPGSNNTGNSGDNVRSIQKDAFKSHNHAAQVTDPGHAHTYLDHAQPAPNTIDSGDRRGFQDHQRTTNPSFTGISVAVQDSGELETRPVNASVKWIIRIAE